MDSDFQKIVDASLGLLSQFPIRVFGSFLLSMDANPFALSLHSVSSLILVGVMKVAQTALWRKAYVVN